MATFLIGARTGFFDAESIEVHFPFAMQGSAAMPIPPSAHTLEVILPASAWPDEATQEAWFLGDQVVMVESANAPTLHASEDETDESGNPVWVIQVQASALRVMTADEEARYKQSRRDATQRCKRARKEQRRQNHAHNN